MNNKGMSNSGVLSTKGNTGYAGITLQKRKKLKTIRRHNV